MGMSSWYATRAFRIICFLLIILLCASAILVGRRQLDRFDHSKSAEVHSLQWWIHPNEQYEFRRLPFFDGLVTSIAVQPQTNTIWASGQTNLLLVSRDRGGTWSQVSLKQLFKSSDGPDDTYALNEICFVDARNGWIVADNLSASSPRLVITNDGGRSWRLMPPLPEDSNVAGAYSASIVGENVYLATDEGLYASFRNSAWRHILDTAVFALHFIDRQNGIFIGINEENQSDSASIYRTSDGGATWKVVHSRQDGKMLWRIHFVDSKRGWVFGEGGQLLRTVDGGLTWTRQNLSTNSLLLAAVFHDAQNGTIYGIDGTRIMTNDGGSTWKTMKSGDVATFIATASLSPKHRIIASSINGLNISDDEGRTWNRALRSAIGTTSLEMQPDRLHGWGLIDLERIVVTEDGGKSWREVASPGPLVRFFNDKDGFAGTWASDLYATNDGGKTWNKRTRPFSPKETDILPVFQFLSITDVVAISGRRMKWSHDGGRNWKTVDDMGYFARLNTNDDRMWINNNPSALFRSAETFLASSTDGQQWVRSRVPGAITTLFFIDRRTGWAVGRKGVIARTDDGGNSWQMQNSTVSVDLTAADFLDVKHGWVAGADGMLLVTHDGGRRWRRIPVGVMEPTGKLWLSSSTIIRKPITSGFSAIAVIDQKTVFVADRTGMLLMTNDGGATWNDQWSHRRRIAPWVWLAMALSILLSLPLLLRPRAEVHRDAVLQMVVNDRPLAAGDADVLAFGEVASGVSNFLRNVGTRGPLTIAIEGPWGSGKSSLMTLLKTDLERFGYRPVWFNAWHHEKEDALLASLLENIRVQALPHPLSFRNLLFRLRLLRIRLARYWIVMGGVLFAFSLGAGTLCRYADDAFWGSLYEGCSAIATGRFPKISGTSAIFVLFTLIGALSTILGHLKTFGISPEKLVASDARVSYRELAGFRHRFANDFRQLTEALDHTLTIFIDDLDRCTPDKMLDVLQSVNFLCTSGECFVIIGMAKQHVLEGLASKFGDVAGPEPERRWWQRRSKTNHRVQYAQHYLEKLVNIEVAVPQPTLEQMQALVVRSADEALRRATGSNHLRELWPRVAAVIPFLLLTTIMIVGFRTGSKGSVQSLPPAFQSMILNRSPGAHTVPAPKPPPQSVTPPRPGLIEVAGNPSASNRPSKLVVAVAHTPSQIPLVALAGVIFLFTAWGALRRPDRETHDTNEFTNALAIWTPLLFASGLTPRAVKRFVNRARYYAMRQRAREKKIVVPDAALVALTAIYEAQPEWLNKAAFYTNFRSFIAAQTLEDRVKHTLLRSDGKELTKHNAECYVELRQGVHI